MYRRKRVWWVRGFPHVETVRERRGERGWMEAREFTCSRLERLVHSRDRD